MALGPSLEMKINSLFPDFRPFAFVQQDSSLLYKFPARVDLLRRREAIRFLTGRRDLPPRPLLRAHSTHSSAHDNRRTEPSNRAKLAAGTVSSFLYWGLQ